MRLLRRSSRTFKWDLRGCREAEGGAIHQKNIPAGMLKVFMKIEDRENERGGEGGYLGEAFGVLDSL